ncbi:uncharacterized protein DEA37_0002022 [Paragonimus westermani]|uniref:SAC3/GANP/THP3 conserved domain-containing protein n=1 Tax=Paragonimus westermani TaxID=34504 RepID=A0A5J4P3E8_9TREM|nr:uncharacterized protein DEA37_0002022 [Paragonimus westermani]
MEMIRMARRVTHDRAVNANVGPVFTSSDNATVPSTKRVVNTPANSPSHRPAVKLSSLPAGLNRKAWLMEYFHRFGTIIRVICQPSLDSAYIMFETMTAAERAKRHGHEPPSDQPAMQPLPSTVAITVTLCRTRPRSNSGAAVNPVDAGRSATQSCPKPENVMPHSAILDSKPESDNPNQSSGPFSFFGDPSHTPTSARLPQPDVPIGKFKGTMVGSTLEERVAILQAHYKIERQKRPAVPDKQTTSYSSQTDLSCFEFTTSVRSMAIRGTCADMCPEMERYFRELHQRVSMDHTRAVKDYERSSADQPVPLPCELRPTTVLHRTMAYLLASIADRPELDTSRSLWKPWYEFMWTRTRAIRKDVVQQRLCCPLIVGVMERIARFHIFCAARLVDQPVDSFDPRINSENLTQCLQTLKEMYNDLDSTRLENAAESSCPNEAEFQAYMLLMRLNDQGALNNVQNLPARLLRTQEVRFAVAVHEAVTTNNHIRFFRLARQANCLAACLMHRYFVQVRGQALIRLATSFAGHPRRDVQAFGKRVVDKERLESAVNGSAIFMAKLFKMTEEINFGLGDLRVEAGVILNMTAAAAFVGWIPVNSRLCAVLADPIKASSRYKTFRSPFIVSVYAPPECSEVGLKGALYSYMDALLRSTHGSDIVGGLSETESRLGGSFGIASYRSANGVRLSQLFLVPGVRHIFPHFIRQYPLATIVRQLGFEDANEAKSFCECWGLTVADDYLIFEKQTPPQPPELAWRERRAIHLIEQKRAGVPLSTLFNNGPVSSTDALPLPVHSSFDHNGRFIPPMQTEEIGQAVTEPNVLPTFSSQLSAPAFSGFGNLTSVVQAKPKEERLPLASNDQLLTSFVNDLINELVDYHSVAKETFIEETVSHDIAQELLEQCIGSEARKLIEDLKRRENHAHLFGVETELCDSVIASVVDEHCHQVAQSCLVLDSLCMDLFTRELLPSLIESVAFTCWMMAKADQLYCDTLLRACFRHFRRWVCRKQREEYERDLLRAMPACPAPHQNVLTLIGPSIWTSLRLKRQTQSSLSKRPRFSRWSAEVDENIIWKPISPISQLVDRPLGIYSPVCSPHTRHTLSIITAWLRIKLVNFTLVPISCDLESEDLKALSALFCLGDPDTELLRHSTESQLPVLAFLPGTDAPGPENTVPNTVIRLNMPYSMGEQIHPISCWSSILQSGLDWAKSRLIERQSPTALFSAYHSVLDRLFEQSFGPKLSDVRAQVAVASSALQLLSSISSWEQFVQQWSLFSDQLNLSPLTQWWAQAAVVRAENKFQRSTNQTNCTPLPSLVPWISLCMAVVRDRLELLMQSTLGLQLAEAKIIERWLEIICDTHELSAMTELTEHFSQLGEPCLTYADAVDQSLKVSRRMQLSLCLDASMDSSTPKVTSSSQNVSSLLLQLDRLDDRLHIFENSMVEALKQTVEASLVFRSNVQSIECNHCETEEHPFE